MKKKNKEKSKNKKENAEYYRVCKAIAKDSVRISVPKAFLSTLTLLFHHVSDAMGGDDRPDHGLAKMRQGSEYYRAPFYLLCGKLKRAEDKMSSARHQKVARLFYRYHELLAERKARMLNKDHGDKKRA